MLRAVLIIVGLVGMVASAIVHQRQPQNRAAMKLTGVAFLAVTVVGLLAAQH